MLSIYNSCSIIWYSVSEIRNGITVLCEGRSNSVTDISILRNIWKNFSLLKFLLIFYLLCTFLPNCVKLHYRLIWNCRMLLLQVYCKCIKWSVEVGSIFYKMLSAFSFANKCKRKLKKNRNVTGIFLCVRIHKVIQNHLQFCDPCWKPKDAWYL